MKAVATNAEQLYEGDCRLDASYHASDGVKALRLIQQWVDRSSRLAAQATGRLRERAEAYSVRRVDTLAEVCRPNSVFIPSRFKRIFVDDPEHGAPYLTGSSIMQADPLGGAKLLSYRFTSNMDELALHKRMILVTCSGTIGNSVYVNENFRGAVGSPDLLRIVADPDKIPPGYLHAFLSSSLGKALIEQKTYGAVVPHIEAHHVTDLPIPRLDSATEERVHELIERAASLRVEAKRPEYTKTDLDMIIRKLNANPSPLREKLDKLSALSDPESGYRLCVNYSGTHERKHDFMINLHLWNQDDPSSFSSFINILKFSRERCAGTRFTPYMAIEFHYEMPEAFGKKIDLVDDIGTRISHLEETSELFWELLRYEWE